MGTAIVAIPKEDEAVWRFSSEKVPHMTILYLGDTENNPRLQQIIEFVQHAASTTLTRFGLSVDRRDKLGADDADVLFFDMHYEYDKVMKFRSFLLANEAISEAYNSTEQFDGWTPHLTMGYPDNPAKEDKRDYPGIGYVGFDRIAVWTGDFEGPEFRLKDRFESDAPLSMSESSVVDDVLAHFGIRGMKWGVRRSKSELSTESPKPTSSDAFRSHDIQKNIKKHGLRAVSNEELKLLNERVQLEQRYNQLFPKKKSVVKMGKDFAWDILEPVAKQQAKAFLNAQADLKINGPLEVGRHMKKK